ncbi:MAG TPA: hypothetical protein VM299_04960 [Solirubrobacteraceae bacterium]|jgi:hypothetical protein|nr:hypothetical protein [Solirubrobacteraceae bacterium]
MRRRLRVLACVALGGAVAALASTTAASAAERRAVLAFYSADPEDVLVHSEEEGEPPTDSLLGFLGDVPGLRVGLWSSSQGDYERQQVLLDISQGARQPTGLYDDVDEDGDDELDELRFDPATRSFSNWQAFVARARDVSRTLRPGLLAGSVPTGAGFAGAAAAPLRPAIAAADERGRVAAVSRGPGATLAERARRLLRSRRLVVVSAPAGPVGRAQLSALARGRGPDELLLVVQLPETPDPEAFGGPPGRYLRQPAFAIGDGRSGSPTSGSTRRDGLVTSIDFAPTLLRWIGIEPPNPMRGQPIEAGAAVGVLELDELRTRWSDTRDGRQSASFKAVVILSGLVFLLLGTWRGIRAAAPPALRIAALGLLWWPSAVLLAAAVGPGTRAGEVFVIAGVSVVLAALTQRLLPWARAPLVPAVVCLVAYSADLALGGRLLTVSALGPSVGSGSRFYGVSNELEPILPIVLLVGLAALTTGREVTRRVLGLYAAAGLALLVVVGWGRLGADVGGVITVGAGVAAAIVVLTPGAITARRLAIAALAPVAALALLVALDLGLSGGSHLARNLLRADDAGELWELVARRYELAWPIATSADRLPYFLGSLVAVAFAWRNRERLYGSLPHRAWAAALIGGLAAGVAGALTNDSGPILLINAVMGLAALTAYVLGRPDDAAPALREP